MVSSFNSWFKRKLIPCSRVSIVIVRTIVLVLIHLYQMVVSQWTPATCRFYPTCSQYTFKAIQSYGVFRGGLLGGKRILRCHPFNSGGYDPVPKLHESISKNQR